jgi:hypothetical protein
MAKREAIQEPRGCASIASQQSSSQDRAEPRSFRENSDERDDGSQRRNSLKADRSHDPFEDIGLDFGDIALEFGIEFGPHLGDIGSELGPHLGDIGSELGPYLGDIGSELGLNSCQIGLGGEILVCCFAQGLGERLSLLRRKTAFVPESSRQAKRIEQNGEHGSLWSWADEKSMTAAPFAVLGSLKVEI